MKKLSICIAVILLAITNLKAQEYQFEGQVNGREATLLLHFVTASNDPNQVWSHGSFYFNDEGIANVIFQYKPVQPEEGEMSFYIIPTNVKQVDNIKGTVSKTAFKGSYHLDSKNYNVDFTAKDNQPLIIYNYYKTDKNRQGNTLKYFGKYISQNNEKAMHTMTAYLSPENKATMPRVYLEDFYNSRLKDFQGASVDWLNNVAVYPIVVTPSRIVYKVNYYMKEGDTVDMDHTVFINYDVNAQKIIDASNFFKSGTSAQIEQIINTESKILGQYTVSELENQHLPYTSNFYLAEKGVVFYYPQIPLENGKVENYQVFVSYDKLSDVMQ